MGPYENVRIPIVNMIINHKIMAHPRIEFPLFCHPLAYSYMNQDTLSALPGFYDVSPGQVGSLLFLHPLGEILDYSIQI